jgi:hypothetical protein
MSRSYARHPKDGWVCYRSNKWARSAANRCLRAATRNFNEETEVFPLLREVSEVYCFPSDGLPGWRDESEHDEYFSCLDSLKSALNAGCYFSEYRVRKDRAPRRYIRLYGEGWGWMLEEVLEKFNLPFSMEGLEQITNKMVAKWSHDYCKKRWAR